MLLFCPSGCTVASIFILLTGYASSPALAVTFLTIGVGITGLNASGYAVNILDIAPQYAGVIMGVTNVFGAAPGFLSPQVVGILTPNKVRSILLLQDLGKNHLDHLEKTRYCWSQQPPSI